MALYYCCCGCGARAALQHTSSSSSSKCALAGWRSCWGRNGRQEERSAAQCRGAHTNTAAVLEQLLVVQWASVRAGAVSHVDALQLQARGRQPLPMAPGLPGDGCWAGIWSGAVLQHTCSSATTRSKQLRACSCCLG
jgi:hypothetical protein